jgi:hypothetical protein
MGGRQYLPKNRSKSPHDSKLKQAPMPKANPAPVKPPQEKHSAVTYLRTLGGISIVGLGALIPPHYYWWGVGIVYLGFLALILDIVFQKWRLRGKVLGCIVLVILITLYSCFVVFVPAPLDVLTNSTWGNYEVGKPVHGIDWETGMTELRFAISNPTNLSYDAIDLIVKPNVPTRKVIQVSSVPDVSLDVLEKAGGLEMANMTVRAIRPDGQPGENIPMDLFASAEGFRLSCPSLPAHKTMQLEVALVTLSVRSDKPETIIMGGGAGPKAIATKVLVKGDYSVLNHPHHVESTYAVRQQ